jgi:hypothetical protein
MKRSGICVNLSAVLEAISKPPNECFLSLLPKKRLAKQNAKFVAV